MSLFLLQLRWSGRDLRKRWVQVFALAFVIALGVGTWSGLGGTARWRRTSNDRSLALLAVHDVRIALAEGSYVGEGTLRAGLQPLVDDGSITELEERLVVNTQVDASTNGRTLLAPGQLVGVDTSTGGPHIDRFDVRRGTSLTDGSVLLDYHFAHDRKLEATGEISLSGGLRVPYAGQALTPDRFVVVSNRGGFFAGNWFAVVYASLDTAQRASKHPGQVNEAVLRVRDTGAISALVPRMQSLLDAALPQTGVSIVPFTDEPVHRMLYEDIKSDQRFYNVFAGLIFAGAIFGAFNLARRMIEAERREIGIGMAIGMTARQLVLRPLLVGIEIAVLGSLSGVGVGLVISIAIRNLLQTFLPLPVWETGVDVSSYLGGAALGAAIPMLGLAWPIVKALRVTPMETMQPQYRLRSRRIPRVGRRMRLPGSSVARIPLRNVLRSVQRTTLTVLAVGATSAVFFAVLGMLDSFRATINVGKESTESTAPGRLAVDLDTVMPVSSATVQAVKGSAAVSAVDAGLRVPGTLLRRDGTDAFGVVLEMRNLATGMWRPTTDPPLPTDGRPGVVLAHKAATDLGVHVGDTVLLRHPRRTGLTSFDYVVTEFEVLALHDIPLRTEVLFDISHAEVMNLAGLVNLLDVLPTTGTSNDEVKRALFPISGVTSVQGVSETVDLYQDLMDSMMGFLVIIEGATLLLVVLVAFNATSINIEERRREHATMLAFGMPLRTVLRTMLVENLLLGLIGGGLGIGLGELLVQWLLKVSLPQTMPEISVSLSVNAGSAVFAFVAAVAAVTLSPLLSLRSLHRIDIPSTLRVVE